MLQVVGAEAPVKVEFDNFEHGFPEGFGPGGWGHLAYAIGILFAVFQLYVAAFNYLPSQVVRGVHVGFLILMTFGLIGNFTARSNVGRAADIAPGGEVADQPEGHQDQEADVNAAHHLARQIVERRDIELEYREQDADRIGQMSPAAGAETFRESVFEIVELDLDGRLRTHNLQHFLSFPAPKSSSAL